MAFSVIKLLYFLKRICTNILLFAIYSTALLSNKLLFALNFSEYCDSWQESPRTKGTDAGFTGLCWSVPEHDL